MKWLGWLKEPLVQFLALGAVLYIGLTWGEDTIDPASRLISVDGEKKAELALLFERQTGRPPTDAELDARVSNFVREEVLFREAVRLGLDQGDAVVRKRMVNKMDLSASVAGELAKPDEATLRAFYDENQEKYAGGDLLDFEQAYYSSEQSALDALAGAGKGPVKGQAIALPATMEKASFSDIYAQFGEAFAQSVTGLDAGEGWQGPVRSGFGWHLVKVTGRGAAQDSFETVRTRVENDWRNDVIEERKKRAFELLHSAYRIEID